MEVVIAKSEQDYELNCYRILVSNENIDEIFVLRKLDKNK